MNNKETSCLGTSSEINSFMKTALSQYLNRSGLDYSVIVEKHSVDSSIFPTFSVYADIVPNIQDWLNFKAINTDSTWQNFIIQTISKSIGDPFESNTFQHKLDNAIKPLSQEICNLKKELKHLENKTIEQRAVIKYIEKSNN